MAQIFHRSANSLAKVSIVAVVLLLAGTVWAAYKINAGTFITDVNVARDQPVPFSHKHHVGDDGIDCRYCHTSVETSSFAGLAPTETCMSCHSQIWANAELLEPVRASFRTGKSLEWTRVHDLPDFVYFNHSIHVNKGIGCSTCHGRVDRMPLMYKVNTLYMQWCVECHRNPAQYVRPRDQVFNIAYQYPDNQLELGVRLVREYKIQSLTDCVTCHRYSMKHDESVYWRSLEELAGADEFRAFVEDEFPHRTPDWNDPESRRGFLRVMGASICWWGFGLH